MLYEVITLVPDRNLGRYIAAHTEKKCHFWEGYCPTHDLLRADEVKQTMAKHPDALFMAHPECPPEILVITSYSIHYTKLYEVS